jgi:predicted transposase/invertase (TIGR01784 family)
MKFIESSDEGVLKMIAERSPQMMKAVGVLKELSADEQMRMLADAREKARRDIASRMNWARHEGRAEGKEEGRQEGREEGRKEGKTENKIEIARKLLARNRPIDEIIEDTGLTRREIESL